jgi:hypothetical protein
MEHRLGHGAEVIVLAKKFSRASYQQHHKVLATLLECKDERTTEYFTFLNFDQIAERSGVARCFIRRITRYLARKGLAEYGRGLFDCEGCPAGAGYAATKLGRVVSEIIHGVSDGETAQDTHHQ